MYLFGEILQLTLVTQHHAPREKEKKEHENVQDTIAFTASVLNIFHCSGLYGCQYCGAKIRKMNTRRPTRHIILTLSLHFLCSH
jgi:hypothetical protein